MPTATLRTDRSVTWTDEATGQERHVFSAGDTFRGTLAFDVTSADDETATGVAAVMTRLDTFADVTTETVEAAEIDATDDAYAALVTVSGLTRGVTYELEFTTEYDSGRAEPRTFVIDCVS